MLARASCRSCGLSGAAAAGAGVAVPAASGTSFVVGAGLAAALSVTDTRAAALSSWGIACWRPRRAIVAPVAGDLSQCLQDPEVIRGQADPERRAARPEHRKRRGSIGPQDRRTVTFSDELAAELDPDWPPTGKTCPRTWISGGRYQTDGFSRTASRFRAAVLPHRCPIVVAGPASATAWISHGCGGNSSRGPSLCCRRSRTATVGHGCPLSK